MTILEIVPLMQFRDFITVESDYATTYLVMITNYYALLTVEYGVIVVDNVDIDSVTVEKE